MTPFHHCSKPYSRKLQIRQIQWLHSTFAVNPYIEIYKSDTIIDYIPPLRHDMLWKITNYTNSMTPFHLCGNPYDRKVQIMQH